MDTADDLVTGELFTGEVFFKESFVCLGNRFRNSGSQTVQTMAEVRHLYLVRLTLFVIGVCLHVDEVDVGFYLTVLNIRNHDWADGRAKGGFEFFKYLVEIRVVSVELADKEHGCFCGILCHLVGFFGADIHAGFTGNGDQNAFSGAHALSQLTGIVEQSGSIDEIDLDGAPCKRSDGSRNRDLTFYLFRVIVTDSVSFRNFPQSIACTCFKEQCFS